MPNKVSQDSDIKDREGTQPKKYHTGLSKSTKEKRDAHFKKGAKMDDNNPAAYKPAPGDANSKTKESKYTKKYKKIYGEEMSPNEIFEEASTALKNKAEESGVSLATLRKVYNRGVAAWRTGHRPGTTPAQWGMARVNSYITKGKTYHTADKDLREKLDADATAGDYVKDFRKSDAPQFKGKSDKKKQQMAIAAYLDARKQKALELESVELEENAKLVASIQKGEQDNKLNKHLDSAQRRGNKAVVKAIEDRFKAINNARSSGKDAKIMSDIGDTKDLDYVMKKHNVNISKLNSLAKKFGHKNAQGWVDSFNEAVDSTDTGGAEETSMAVKQIAAMRHFLDGIEARVKKEGDMEEWYQNKLTKANDYLQTLYSYGKGDVDESMDPRDFTDKPGHVVVVTRKDGTKTIRHYHPTSVGAKKYADRVNKVNRVGDKATVHRTDGRKLIGESVEEAYNPRAVAAQRSASNKMYGRTSDSPSKPKTTSGLDSKGRMIRDKNPAATHRAMASMSKAIAKKYGTKKEEVDVSEDKKVDNHPEVKKLYKDIGKTKPDSYERRRAVRAWSNKRKELRKEETEQVDELKNVTLQRYKTAAGKVINNRRKKYSDAEVEKRGKGYALASQKLTNRILSKEEVKTIKVGEDAVGSDKCHYALVMDRKVTATGTKEEMLAKCAEEGGRVWVSTKQVGDIVEATFKVEVDGLPTFYMNGVSPAKVKASLRKLLRKASSIDDVERVTPTKVRADYRDRVKNPAPDSEKGDEQND